MIEDHRHCEICHRTVGLEDRFCDRQECADQHQANIKEKKRQMWIFGLIVVGVLLYTQMIRYGLI